MEEQVPLDMAALEKSTTPEHHKPPRRAKLTRYHAALRAQQHRIEATTHYRSDGTQCRSHVEIGEEMRRKWAPIFRERHIDPEATHIFWPCVQPAELDASWS